MASEASPFSVGGSAWEIHDNVMKYLGSCWDMLGIMMQCWNLLQSVPKLINSKANFPFIVRAGFGILLKIGTCMQSITPYGLSNYM